MNRAGMLLLVFALAICSGCVVVSLQPLWSPEVAARDENLEGTWLLSNPFFKPGQDDLWTISRDERGGYEIRIVNRPSENVLTHTCFARLARIGESLYLDLQSKSSERGPDLIPAHQFMRLTIDRS